MKIAFYNPPAPTPIIRRYMCSYNAGANLYPNIELLGLAALARDRGHTAVYIDCVAENWTTAAGTAVVKAAGVDLLVGMCGLECFQDDIAELKALKRELPGLAVGLLGYYPTLHPRQCLEAGFDFILLGEGEPGLDALLQGLHTAPGLATADGYDAPALRLSQQQFDTLPSPAHDLIDPGLYSELGLGSSLTVAQFTRGCPYPCSYCIRSYGRKTVRRSPQKVLEELTFIRRQGIRHVRILDDTFLTDRKWAIEICRGILKEKLALTWGALSRVDNLDEELLEWMHRAGCRRLFIGIESGSQRILDYYKKGYKVPDMARRVRLVRPTGIEAVGFFIIGAPIEKWSDVRQSIALAKQCDLDFVIVTKLVVYPGTALENDIGELADINPWTSRHRFSDFRREQEILTWERRFYRAFYTSPAGLRTGLRTLRQDPGRALKSALDVLRFSFSAGSPGKHPDYL